MLAQKLKVVIQGLKCHLEMGFSHRVEGTVLMVFAKP